MDRDFVECLSCQKLPGSPTLCSSCLHNRRVILSLKRDLLRTAQELANYRVVAGVLLDERWN